MYRLTTAEKTRVTQALRAAALKREENDWPEADVLHALRDTFESASTIVLVPDGSNVRPSFLMPVLGDVLDPRD